MGAVQGDMEKAAGLPVSALMDRSMKGGMTRSQVQASVLLKRVLPHILVPMACCSIVCIGTAPRASVSSAGALLSGEYLLYGVRLLFDSIINHRCWVLSRAARQVFGTNFLVPNNRVPVMIEI